MKTKLLLGIAAALAFTTSSALALNLPEDGYAHASCPNKQYYNCCALESPDGYLVMWLSSKKHCAINLIPGADRVASVGVPNSCRLDTLVLLSPRSAEPLPSGCVLK